MIMIMISEFDDESIQTALKIELHPFFGSSLEINSKSKIVSELKLHSKSSMNRLMILHQTINENSPKILSYQ